MAKLAKRAPTLIQNNSNSSSSGSSGSSNSSDINTHHKGDVRVESDMDESTNKSLNKNMIVKNNKAPSGRKWASSSSSSSSSSRAEDEVEDQSELLMKQNPEDLQPTYPKLWHAYDIIMSYIATYWTHAPGEASVMERLMITSFIMTCGLILQYLYFSCGSLDRPDSGQHKIDKWWHIAIAHMGNIVFYWEFVYGMYRQYVEWSKPSNSSSIASLLVSLSLGFYLTLWCSDVIAGIVHWAGDTLELYFFQYHHRDSRYMTRQSYVHHTWDTFLLAFALSYTIAPILRTSSLGRAIRIVAAQTNECHMWAHCASRERPGMVQKLQDWGLILSWKAHSDHHKPPHLVDYCVFNGWANPVMNRVLPGPLTNSLIWLRETKGFQNLRVAFDM